MQVRNVIIEEEHAKLKAAVTMRKTILSGKRQVIDGKHRYPGYDPRTVVKREFNN